MSTIYSHTLHFLMDQHLSILNHDYNIYISIVLQSTQQSVCSGKKKTETSNGGCSDDENRNCSAVENLYGRPHELKIETSIPCATLSRSQFKLWRQPATNLNSQLLSHALNHIYTHTILWTLSIFTPVIVDDYHNDHRLDKQWTVAVWHRTFCYRRNDPKSASFRNTCYNNARLENLLKSHSLSFVSQSDQSLSNQTHTRTHAHPCIHYFQRTLIYLRQFSQLNWWYYFRECLTDRAHLTPHRIHASARRTIESPPPPPATAVVLTNA